MKPIEYLNPLDDTARINMHRTIESEMTLEEAREVKLADMNQEELTVVILHDPDLSERRAALRLLKIDILADAEIRVVTALAQARR